MFHQKKNKLSKKISLSMEIPPSATTLDEKMCEAIEHCAASGYILLNWSNLPPHQLTEQGLSE